MVSYYFLLLLSAVLTVSHAVYTEDEIIQIYRNFDVKENETPTCLELDYSFFLCPEEEHIPCAGDEEVKKFCYSKLGLSIDEPIPITTYDGTNEINGCVTFVGWGDKQVGCCPSKKCFQDDDSSELEEEDFDDSIELEEDSESIDDEEDLHDEF